MSKSHKDGQWQPQAPTRLSGLYAQFKFFWLCQNVVLQQVHLGNQKPGIGLGTEACDQLSWHFKTKCVWHSFPLSEHVNSALGGKKKILMKYCDMLSGYCYGHDIISLSLAFVKTESCLCPWDATLTVSVFSKWHFEKTPSRKKKKKTPGVLNDANYDSILTAELQLDLLSAFMWLITPASFLLHVCNNTEVK